MLPLKALLDRAVGEACAHVQGESLKAYAAFLVSAFQLPDHQSGEINAMQSKPKGYAGLIAACIAAIVGFSYLSNKPSSPEPRSDKAATEWMIGQLDLNHTLAKAQIRDCMSRPGCDVTAPVSSNGISAENGSLGARQTDDPYASAENNAEMKDYEQKREVLLTKVRYLYFAVGCKVVASEAGILPLVSELSALVDQAAQSGSKVIIDQNGQILMRKAAEDGMSRASNQNACEYWKQHPEEVMSVRRQVLAAQP